MDRARTQAAAALSAGAIPRTSARSFVDADYTAGEDAKLAGYLDALPELLSAAIRANRDGWASGNTQEMVEAGTNVLTIIETAWLRLAQFFADEPFGNDPAEFLSALMGERARWHRLLAEPGGVGTGGTIVRILTVNAMVSEAAKIVEDTALSLLGMSVKGEEVAQWLERWRSAIETLNEDGEARSEGAREPAAGTPPARRWAVVGFGQGWIEARVRNNYGGELVVSSNPGDKADSISVTVAFRERLKSRRDESVELMVEVDGKTFEWDVPDVGEPTFTVETQVWRDLWLVKTMVAAMRRGRALRILVPSLDLEAAFSLDGAFDCLQGVDTLGEET